MNTKIGMIVVSIYLLAGGASADDMEKGLFTVSEMGFGRFRAINEEGTEFLLHLSRGMTQFEPDQWEMHVGDKVYVEYWPTFRDRPTPTCVLIRLEEPGPQTQALTSPMEARVEEMGRTAIRVRKTVEDRVVTFTFALGRRTTYVPSGWVPQAGEALVVHFSMRPARFGWGHTLVADRIEKQ
jgi:hypothetical protein